MFIYLQTEVQRDVLELFDYALNAGGFLLLGKSETVDRSDLFRAANKKVCLYRRRSVEGQETRVVFRK
jgi:two-component system CheB/CheR fusion protein